MNRISVMGGLFAAFMLLIVMSRLVYATSDVVGAPSNPNSPAGALIEASPITASTSGSLLQSLGVNLFSGGNGNVRLALYSNSGGYPYMLLCNSTSQSTISSGWDYLNVSSCGIGITGGTTYWVAVQLSSAADMDYYSSGGGRALQYQSYGAFPSTYSATVTDSYSYNLGMIYGDITTTSTTTTSTSTTSTSTSTTSTSTSTSTTTIPTSTTTAISTTTVYSPSNSIFSSALTNATQTSSIPQVFSYLLALPFAGEGLTILAFGLAFITTRKMRVALLSGFLISAILYSDNAALITPLIPIVLGALLGYSVAADLWSRRARRAA